ncbi:MAG: glycosyltransferase, partial [Novosphingobium sp.]|nr:glycosyltransferase [Novosphingobium sp.]
VMPLFREEDVGIVQTPQHFINPDPIQSNLKAQEVWPDEQRYFFEVVMPAKDAWDTAFCCGTSSVIRLGALAKAGGLPTDSVTEDYLLTLRLKRLGYRTIYLNERLSLGLAPEGLKEYITQRSRWALGFAQIVRGPDGPLRFGNGLALRDRLSLIETMLYWSAAYIFRLAALLVPIFYLLFDIRAVDVDMADAIAYFFPAYLAQIVVMSWLSGHRNLPVMTDVSQLLSAREIIAGFFIGIFRPKGHSFKVTAKGGDRSKLVVQWQMMAWFGLLLTLTLGGVVITFNHDISLQDSSALALYWSWYNIIVLTVAMLVCIERPRLRLSERLRGALDVRVRANGRVSDYRTADISLGGLRLTGVSPGEVGDRVEFEIDGMLLTGRVVRVAQQDFAIAVDKSADAQMAMMRLVYSGGLENSIQRVRKRQLVRKLAYRMLD